MAEQTPSWRLVSVLFSTVQLDAALAATLHQAALELLRRDEVVTPVAGDVLRGRVVNLRKELLLGTIGGPAFEAELDTARGSGKVRFLLTREALELAQLEVRAPRPAGPRPLLH